MRKLLFPLAFIFQFALAQEAEVTNVTAAQRTDGSKLVDITYDITEDSLLTAFNVSVEVSFDGGANYTQINYVDGDVGVNLLFGTDKTIVWNIGQEYSNTFDDNVKVKVIAVGHIAGELPFEMVTVEAGDYTYGSNNYILTIDYDFDIMKYEVTNAQYAEFLLEEYESGTVSIVEGDVLGFYPGDEQLEGGYYDFYDLGTPSGDYNFGRISWNGTTFIVTEGYGNHPCLRVTWFGAWAFAEHYGLRLPTEYEWEKAARGNTGYNYPWGDFIDGNEANYHNSGDPWDNGTTPVGFYNGQNYEGYQTLDAPSPYGVYDVSGNVWEWTDSFETENDPDARVARGGSWYQGPSFCHPWERNYTNPRDANDIFGFRCARTL